MGKKTIALLVLGVFIAYRVYTPLPANVEGPWKIMCLTAVVKTALDLVTVAELLGIGHHMSIIMFFLRLQDVSPTSDENITVMDTTFDSVPVRIYIPNQKSEALKRGLFYIHGGGWSLGSYANFPYDSLSRQTAKRLDAVVVSTNYRLVPKYLFPSQFEDVYKSLKWFLRQDVLKRYGVDPKRIGVSGDSAGGNLAAAVSQQIYKTVESL